MADEYINKTELLFEMATSLIPQSMDITMGYGIAKDLIRKAPVADVAPVVHAYWDTVESERFWICNMEESLKTGKPTKVYLPMCSHCKTKFGTIAFDFKHCPECGATMDGGNTDE